KDSDWKATRDLVRRLRQAYQPLTDLYARSEPQPLAKFVQAHVAVAETLAQLPDDNDSGSPLWQGEAGEAASVLLASLLDPALVAPQITATEYPDFYRSLVADENVRTSLPAHPRLFIWGLLESRLQCPDVVILGGLNEGTWPHTPDPGPWLNRPMRRELGLPQPEVRIGDQAHDFAQLLGAPTVYLTRAEKVDGAPTVPSRWLLRIRRRSVGLGRGVAPGRDGHWPGWPPARS